MAVFKCARCDRFVDIDAEEYLTVGDLEICGNCAEDEEMECDCGERKCEEAAS